jgi:hypothetical protein
MHHDNDTKQKDSLTITHGVVRMYGSIYVPVILTQKSQTQQTSSETKISPKVKKI